MRLEFILCSNLFRVEHTNNPHMDIQVLFFFSKTVSIGLVCVSPVVSVLGKVAVVFSRRRHPTVPLHRQLPPATLLPSVPPLALSPSYYYFLPTLCCQWEPLSNDDGMPSFVCVCVCCLRARVFNAQIDAAALWHEECGSLGESIRARYIDWCSRVGRYVSLRSQKYWMLMTTSLTKLCQFTLKHLHNSTSE